MTATDELTGSAGHAADITGDRVSVILLYDPTLPGSPPQETVTRLLAALSGDADVAVVGPGDVQSDGSWATLWQGPAEAGVAESRHAALQEAANAAAPVFHGSHTAPPDTRPCCELAAAGTAQSFLEPEATEPPPPRVLVTLNGEFFPSSLWLWFLAFVKTGGHWVHLGGMPFRRPVWRGSDGGWQTGALQSRYHRTLGLMNGYDVDVSAVHGYAVPEENPVLAGCAGALAAADITAFTVRFTPCKDQPDELGSSGPIDAEISSLMLAIGEHGKRLASPVVRVDNVRGDFAGSRWLLSSFRPSPEYQATDDWCALVLSLVLDAAEGPLAFNMRPLLACYDIGSVPSLVYSLDRFDASPASYRLSIKVTRDGSVVCDEIHDIVNARTTVAGEAILPVPVTSGLHIVEADLYARARAGDRLLHRSRTGFWGKDDDLLCSGVPLTVFGDYFRKGDEVYPVVGTTYMAGDVHRKFLLDPNPYVWDRDFREMKAAGVNMVRTGIWTLWRQVMPSAGLPNQAALRALDAFVLTARKYDMPVIFTFFAFLPETWEGLHPYLDPRAQAAQKEYVRTIAGRYSAVPGLIWDLINEPSFSNPGKLWSTRPTPGKHELAAWRDWLRAHYCSIEALQDAWRVTPACFGDFGDVPLPVEEDFNDNFMYQDRNPLPVGDFRLFAQDVFRGWARAMAGVIRETAGDGDATLITVGPDEGGLRDCPSSHFFAGEIDFTCMHTWWNNDSLLWDHILAKVPGKPNLVEETGVMFSERVQGLPRRSERDVRDLLERKFAYAFATGAAGVIEWLWNINYHMDNNNEVEVGALRADLTERPQAEVIRRFAAFISSARGYVRPAVAKPVWMVIPHSYQFSVKLDCSLQATRKAILALEQFSGVQVACIGEREVHALELEQPRFILVPCPQILPLQAWDSLVRQAGLGATVLVTGAVSRDEHWRPVRRLRDLGLESEIRPVARHEPLWVGDREVYFHYSGMKTEHMDKELVTVVAPGAPEDLSRVTAPPEAGSATLPVQEGTQAAMQIPAAPAAVDRCADCRPPVGCVTQTRRTTEIGVGAGRLLLCPLPIELSDNYDEVALVYAEALKHADIPRLFDRPRRDPGVLVRPMEYEDAVMYGVISETDVEREVVFTHLASQTDISLRLPGLHGALIMVGKRDGQVLASCLPEGSELRVR